jgi:hypothetical protein
MFGIVNLTVLRTGVDFTNIVFFIKTVLLNRHEKVPMQYQVGHKFARKF